MNLTCAILAGGKSRRMGRDKATLMVGDKQLINRVYDKTKRVFKEVIILSNHHNGIYGIDAPIFKDVIPVHGPMVGIVSALMHTRTPYVFVLACDMPNITEKAIEYMIDEVHGEDVIIPKTKSGYEPCHAIYNRSCISYMLRLIEMNRLQITALFPYLSVRELGEHPYFFNEGISVFKNINTEEDIPAVRGRD
jgi:molybdopterin-guanine dinucleotide biosynthesis protein A